MRSSRAFLTALAVATISVAGCTQEAGAPLGSGMSDGRVAILDASLRRSNDPIVRFAFDRSDLDATARTQVARQAQWLAGNPDAAVRVTGHADLVGSAAYNADLGRRRALAVVSQLVAFGVDPRRVIGVVSLGETAPLVPREGREPLNRRAVVEVAWLGYVPLDLRVQRSGAAFGMDGVRAQAVYDIYQTPGEGAVSIESGGI